MGGDAGASEVVVLRASGDAASNVESLVTGLLLPDAPVVVWWPDNPPATPSQSPLGRIAQRRITDASTVPFEATRVAHLGDCYSPGDTDLAWTAVEVRGAETSPSTALLAAWLRLTLGVPVDWHYLSPDEWSDGIKSVRLTRASGDIVLERSSTAIACLMQPGQPQHDLVLPRRTLRECLAEELRRLDADLLYGRVITEGWALLGPAQSQETDG